MWECAFAGRAASPNRIYEHDVLRCYDRLRGVRVACGRWKEAKKGPRLVFIAARMVASVSTVTPLSPRSSRPM